jgi:hypothetical protein
MKGSTILALIAGGIAAYMFIPKVKETAQQAAGGVTTAITVGSLLPNVKGESSFDWQRLADTLGGFTEGMADTLSGFEGADVTHLTNTFDEFTNKMSGSMDDFMKVVIDRINRSSPETPSIPTLPTPTKPSTSTKTDERTFVEKMFGVSHSEKNIVERYWEAHSEIVTISDKFYDAIWNVFGEERMPLTERTKQINNTGKPYEKISTSDIILAFQGINPYGASENKQVTVSEPVGIVQKETPAEAGIPVIKESPAVKAQRSAWQDWATSQRRPYSG